MISKDKQYRTRDGREVRIYATDHSGDFSVIGAVKVPLEGWVHCTWKRDGSSYYGREEHPTDLIEIRPRIKREVWLALYDDGDVYAYPNEESARNGYLNLNRIALVKRVIDCEEGEGL